MRISKGCGEKLQSYQMLRLAGVPVLESVIISRDEITKMSDERELEIRMHLNSDFCMLRYIYKSANHLVKNGGKIVRITKQELLNELEPDADLWLLEPSKREDNVYCCNVCVNKELGHIHIEVLGEGFDISDINKGKISPHERIDIPFPIYYGAYGDWWKWADFHFCTQKEYEESVRIRKDRLRKFGVGADIEWKEAYVPMGLEHLEHIFQWIQQIWDVWADSLPAFWNVSCSFEKVGRVIFWDIQTPEGKVRAYWK